MMAAEEISVINVGDAMREQENELTVERSMAGSPSPSHSGMTTSDESEDSNEQSDSRELREGWPSMQIDDHEIILIDLRFPVPFDRSTAAGSVGQGQPVVAIHGSNKDSLVHIGDPLILHEPNTLPTCLSVTFPAIKKIVWVYDLSQDTVTPEVYKDIIATLPLMFPLIPEFEICLSYCPNSAPLDDVLPSDGIWGMLVVLAQQAGFDVETSSDERRDWGNRNGLWKLHFQPVDREVVDIASQRLEEEAID